MPQVTGDKSVTAEQVFEQTGIEGGLVVHLGCADGKLTAALRASDGFLVHGLDADGERVSQARSHVRALDLYGKVAVDRFDIVLGLLNARGYAVAVKPVRLNNCQVTLPNFEHDRHYADAVSSAVN